MCVIVFPDYQECDRSALSTGQDQTHATVGSKFMGWASEEPHLKNSQESP